MNIVIVESAAKAKTINKYLGRDYKVIPSFGHVRDLPSKDGSVLPDQDFEMSWDTSTKSSKILKEIIQAVKGADKLILATDPDREGEAISWHILQVLEKKKLLKNIDVERIVFNAVTRKSIEAAIKAPRTIDTPLVSAYLARRALDYLVGFTLSPVLWRKLPGSRSAGRVQSVSLRLVCDREAKIESFKSREYWTLTALLSTDAGATFMAKLISVEGRKLGKYDLANEQLASPLKGVIEGAKISVREIESKAKKRYPSPPFTTSTLQQEASRKLGFSASETMHVAQKLYEGIDLGGETQGLITYMRTDGVQIISEAIESCRAVISKTYGSSYVPQTPRLYKTKAKNAQEAHEAVRPTELSRLPSHVKNRLETSEYRLYELIWKRTIASQMENAEFEQTGADIEVEGADGKNYGLRATGSVLKFDGFLKLYEEGRDDRAEKDDDKRLPLLREGDALTAQKVEAKQHFTEPPPRFTEATLVKKMEELGIGRPSTYASTLSVLRDREYVRMEKKCLVPEGKGRLVTAFLESFFNRYVEYDFTANLEEQLDLISAGKLQWKDVLRDFWHHFSAAAGEIKDLRITEVLDALNDMLGPLVFPDMGNGKDPRKCPSCEDGQIGLKVGKFGAFVGCANYPECRYTRQFTKSANENETPVSAEATVLGVDPETGLEVTLRSGRFGPYVQLGEALDGEKPKRASIPRNVDIADVDLKRALTYLSLPRTIGNHPETKKAITTNFGRYGPYVTHDGIYANLENAEDIFTIGINRAVTLIAEKKASGPKRASAIKELGEHPELGGPIQIMDGRYGPYAKHGKINATLPKSADPQTVTLEEAVQMIAEKAAKSGKKQFKAKAKSKAKPKPKTKAKGKTSASDKKSTNKPS